MMGNRGAKSGAEYDAFSRRMRRWQNWGRGELRRIKRKFWKRTRKDARLTDRDAS